MGYFSIERFNNMYSGKNTQEISYKRIVLSAISHPEDAGDPFLFDSQECVNQYKCELLNADEKGTPLKEFADKFPAYVKSSAYLGNLGQDLEFVAPYLADYEPLSPFLTNFKTPGSIIDLPTEVQDPKHKRSKAADYIGNYLDLMVQANTEGNEKGKIHSLLNKNYYKLLDSMNILKQQKAVFALVWPYLNENIFKVPDPIPGDCRNIKPFPSSFVYEA